MRTALTILVVLLSALVPSPGQGTLKIHHINVGQGSSTLIEGPTGITCLIDAGEFGEGYGTVVPYMLARGITHLDIIVLTHFHADHWGGIPEVVASGFVPSVTYDRGNANITSNINGYLAAAGATRTTIAPGTIIDLGQGAGLQCVCVNGQVLAGPTINVALAQEENARSIGLRLTYGNFQHAICGDLTGGGSGTADVESFAAVPMGDVDGYVVNHHGSRTSTNSTWMSLLAPEISICSCGAVSPFGHPHAETIANILGQPSTVAFYRINAGNSLPGGAVVNGNLLVTTDGGTYTVSGGSVAPVTFTVDEGGAPVPQAYLPGAVVISEFLALPSASPDVQGEWVELTNTTGAPVELLGFRLEDLGTDSYVFPAFTVPARGRVLIAASGNSALNGGIAPDLVWPAGSFVLDNGGDRIRLRDAAGTVLDEVDYGGIYLPPAGVSVERRDLSALPVLSNAGLSTAVFGAGDRGTPGALNSLDATPPWVALGVAGPLTPGTTATVSVAGGLPWGARAYVLGLSTSPAPAIILPASARGVNLCYTTTLAYSLLQPNAGRLAGFAGQLNILGFSTASIQIPAWPELVGARFYLSGVVLDVLAPDGVGAVLDDVVMTIN